MKIKGKDISKPSEEVVVIPRGETEFVFKACAVLDFTEFEKLCPMPQAPQIVKPGGESFEDVTDVKYIKALDQWSTRKSQWMMIKSLGATEGLEWSTVIANDPSTWENFESELDSSGLTPIEISRVMTCVMDACGFNQDKIDEATKRFLAGVVADQKG